MAITIYGHILCDDCIPAPQTKLCKKKKKKIRGAQYWIFLQIRRYFPTHFGQLPMPTQIYAHISLELIAKNIKSLLQWNYHNVPYTLIMMGEEDRRQAICIVNVACTQLEHHVIILKCLFSANNDDY